MKQVYTGDIGITKCTTCYPLPESKTTIASVGKQFDYDHFFATGSRNLETLYSSFDKISNSPTPQQPTLNHPKPTANTTIPSPAQNFGNRRILGSSSSSSDEDYAFQGNLFDNPLPKPRRITPQMITPQKQIYGNQSRKLDYSSSSYSSSTLSSKSASDGKEFIAPLKDYSSSSTSFETKQMMAISSSLSSSISVTSSEEFDASDPNLFISTTTTRNAASLNTTPVSNGQEKQFGMLTTSNNNVIWQWLDDKGWANYDIKTSAMIEEAFQQNRYLIKLNHGYFGKCGGYTVNLRKNIQMRNQTGYTRNIKRIVNP
eukprot:TRINITY_DN2038_c3_g1_i2.p1 TRINITY_DN2038_c3_g1~~TRINITY_DN2038_c3_g1_i2.p1  ORF type:complete len:329 (-),score=58.68 TRINITY_DN2038_c3_g1_i2:21-965(-)